MMKPRCEDPRLSILVGKILREVIKDVVSQRERILSKRGSLIPLTREQKERGRELTQKLNILGILGHNHSYKQSYPLKRDPKTGRMMKARKE